MKKISFLLLLASASAHANVCVTQSRGLYFSDTNYDVRRAHYNTIQQCRSNPFAIAYECDRQITCSPYNKLPYPSGSVTCFASSRGFTFVDQGPSYDINTVSVNAVEACRMRSDRFGYSECENTLACADAYSSTPTGNAFTCHTNSRGQAFQLSGTDINYLRGQVVSMCERNRYTSNSECRKNLHCTSLQPGYPGGHPGGDFPPGGGHHPGPAPLPPETNPQPVPHPPGTHLPPGAHACHSYCQVGAVCTDGCPIGGACKAFEGYWEVRSCSGGGRRHR